LRAKKEQMANKFLQCWIFVATDPAKSQTAPMAERGRQISLFAFALPYAANAANHPPPKYRSTVTLV
jgi:hypothetical protein